LVEALQNCEWVVQVLQEQKNKVTPDSKSSQASGFDGAYFREMCVFFLLADIRVE
jgi:hypothetical protein